MSLAQEIVELFELLLDEKGIEIPCSDETEEKERHEGGNVAKLYGMEYAKLVDRIEELLVPEIDEEMLVKKTVGGRNRIKDAPGILCSETCERFTDCDTCPIQKAIDKLARYEQQEKRELSSHGEILDVFKNSNPDKRYPNIKGITYQLSEGDNYSYWSGFSLSKEDEDAIAKILKKYETDGCTVSGTSREVIEETVPAAMFKLDMSKKPVQIATHQVKNRLLCLLDECNSARIKALKENKMHSEVQLHMSMQHIYALLIKLIPDK